MQRFRLEKSDKAIILAALVLAATSAYMLIEGIDFQVTTSTLRLEEIARLTYKRSEVRRRSDESLVWSDVDHEAPLFENDSLFTGANSEAELKFEGGASLHLGPSSLVVLQKHSNSLLLDLRLGAITTSISNGGNLYLKQGRRVIGLGSTSAAASKLQVTRTLDDGLVLSSPETELEIQIDGNTELIEPHQPIELSSEAEVQPHKLTAQLLEPRNQDILWISSGDSVRFRWTTPVNTKSNLQLELSPDPQFATIVVTKLVGDQLSTELPELVPDKAYYWRLIDPTSQRLTSPIGYFQLSQKTAPVPRHPLPNYKVVAPKPLADGGPPVIHQNFSWSTQAGMRSFHLQVARDATFEEVAYEKTGLQFPEALIPLSLGEYYWRVRAEDPEAIATLWSETLHLSIVDVQSTPALAESPPLEARSEPIEVTSTALPESPKVHTPQSAPPLPQSAPERIVSALPDSAPAPVELGPPMPTPIPQLPMDELVVFSVGHSSPFIHFQWQSSTTTGEYEIQIAGDAQFQNLIREEKVRDPKYLLSQQILKGPIFWRVRAVQAGREPSSWAKVRRVYLF